MTSLTIRFHLAKIFRFALLIALLWVFGSRQPKATAAPTAPIIVEEGWTLVQSVAIDTPQAAHYNPQDGLVYVIRRVTGGTGGLYRVNADSSLTQVAVGDRPAGVVVDYDDGDIFFSEDYGGNIYQHDFSGAIPSRSTWVSAIDTGDEDLIGMAIAPNDYSGPVLVAGEAIVVDRGNGDTDEIWGWSPDTAEGEVQFYTDSASGGTLVDALDVAVTTDAIYIVDGKEGADGAIYRLIDINTVEEVATAITFNEPAGIAVTPNNTLLIADSATDKIVRLDPYSGTVSDLFTGFGNLAWVSVDMSPDGKTIVVTDSTAEYVYIFKDTQLVVNSTGDESDSDLGDDNCDIDLGASDNQCTLRAAIEQANVRPGRDRIVFNIPGEAYVIELASPLPTLTDSLTIDGSSQPGSVCPTPAIQINGSAAGSGVDGLSLASSGNIIKGLMITNFSGNGLAIPFGSNDNTIQCNFIGTNGYDSSSGNGGHGLKIESSQGNLIGGLLAEESNVISGNGEDGIYISTTLPPGNLVQGNLIGLDAAGISAIPNLQHGLEIIAAAENNIGPANVISGNGLDGVHISHYSTGNIIRGNIIGLSFSGDGAIGNGSDGIELFNSPQNIIGGVGQGNVVSGNLDNGIVLAGTVATDNVVQGNFIGTDPAGTAPFGNSSNGLMIASGQDNLIGGPATGEGNLISGNSFTGIYISGSYAGGSIIQGNKIGTDITGAVALANGPAGYGVGGIRLFAADTLIGGTVAGAGNLISGNFGCGIELGNNGQATIQGNYVGTDGAGMVALPNTRGVCIYNSDSNIIGGTIPAARNLISGNNGDGLTLFFATSDNNVVQGNYIGADATGAFSLGNGDAGVLINDAPNNLIGGDEDGAGNLIGGNVGHGIEVSGNGATGNALRANAIEQNGGRGIDLGADGVTLNDVGDGDSGENGLQNFPLLGPITAGGGIVHLQASLDTISNTVQILDFYSSVSCDQTGYGEGARYLGTITASTDSNGQLQLDQNLGFYAPLGHFLTATATDPAGNSSEFSPCGSIGQISSSLSGQVEGPAGTVLSGSTVGLFVQVAEGSQTVWYLAQAQPAVSDGSFHFANLPLGNYLVQASDDSNTFATEYWLDADNLGLATTIVFSEPVSIILPSPIELTAGGSISGTVTSESTGLPLVGIKVTAVFNDGGNWKAYRTATTASNGRYLIGNLPAGDYRLYFNDPKLVYNSEYYDNTFNFDLASSVTVVRSFTTPDRNATLKIHSPIVYWDTTGTTDTPCTVRVLANNRIHIRRHRSHPSCQLNLTTQPGLISCPVGITPANVQLLSENNVYGLTESSAGSGRYTSGLITLASSWSTDRDLILSVQWSCNSVTQSTTIGNFQLYDPSGIVSDLNTGLPIAGATVTLYNVPDWRARTHADDVATMTCESNLSKAAGAPWSQTAPTLLGVAAVPLPNLIDPTLTSQITDSEGYYGWDVAAGCWYVVVEADGYETLVSPVVGVPTEVTDLDLMLRPDSPTAIQLSTIQVQSVGWWSAIILLVACLLLGWQLISPRMKNN